ncbi:PEP-CTERM sorting domain-containing protein [Paucibacter sp. KCTC 42545]|uniref:PEP-CTERM sorting domain-containing protein n=1 Tax=Paucibacter sp. KCTC 42545 TaxID=1768242 RepID=UPI0009E7055F|nr:PEP-CTERM sorting domain-containing protein [Paucibacter sp. KCTC 42545]
MSKDVLVYRPLAHALALLGACSALSLAPMAQAAPNLDYNAYAQVYGWVNTSFTSPVLGDGSFSLNGKSDYKNNWKGSGNLSTGVADATFTIATGPGGLDPVYDIVTSAGKYGMGYTGQAESAGLSLHTKVSSHLEDNTGALVQGNPVDLRSNLTAYAQANWSQQFFIAATAARPTGSYGAILVSAKLDGNFPSLSDPSVYNSAWANMQIGSTFTDTAGVNYTSNFEIYTSSSDPNWTGAKTVYKKLLFQYGTVFNLNAYQYTGVGSNGSADFFNTGRISSIELPFGATLESGAQQAGLGSLAALYGTVTNSATVDDINTNWDFGNNGGGFNPPVPEPASSALLLAGLGVLGLLAKRQRRQR